MGSNELVSHAEEFQCFDTTTLHGSVLNTAVRTISNTTRCL
jgi:hypothetical protein